MSSPRASSSVESDSFSLCACVCVFAKHIRAIYIGTKSCYHGTVFILYDSLYYITNKFDKQINGLLKGGTSCSRELFIEHVKVTLPAPSGPSVSGQREAMHWSILLSESECETNKRHLWQLVSEGIPYYSRWGKKRNLLFFAMIMQSMCYSNIRRLGTRGWHTSNAHGDSKVEV